MDAKAALTPTKSSMQLEEIVESTATQLTVAVEGASTADGSSWVLPFMELPSGMAAFEDELLLKTGKPTVEILAECVKDTLEAVQNQKSSENFTPDMNTEKFLENDTTFVEKYNVWKGSLEKDEEDVCDNEHALLSCLHNFRNASGACTFFPAQTEGFFNAFMSFVGSMLISMYAIGVCNIATKLFLMITDPAALEPPLGDFQGWNARWGSMYHFLTCWLVNNVVCCHSPTEQGC